MIVYVYVYVAVKPRPWRRPPSAARRSLPPSLWRSPALWPGAAALVKDGEFSSKRWMGFQ